MRTAIASYAHIHIYILNIHRYAYNYISGVVQFQVLEIFMIYTHLNTCKHVNRDAVVTWKFMVSVLHHVLYFILAISDWVISGGTYV